MWKKIPKKSIGEGVVGCELLRAQRSYGAALDPPALQNQPTAFWVPARVTCFQIMGSPCTSLTYGLSQTTLQPGLPGKPPSHSWLTAASPSLALMDSSLLHPASLTAAVPESFQHSLPSLATLLFLALNTACTSCLLLLPRAPKSHGWTSGSQLLPLICQQLKTQLLSCSHPQASISCLFPSCSLSIKHSQKAVGCFFFLFFFFFFSQCVSTKLKRAMPWRYRDSSPANRLVLSAYLYYLSAWVHLLLPTIWTDCKIFVK